MLKLALFCFLVQNSLKTFQNWLNLTDIVFHLKCCRLSTFQLQLYYANQIIITYRIPDQYFLIRPIIVMYVI